MTKDMTVGSPFKLILMFAIPLLIGNIFQQFYSMADSIIVGQFIGAHALAAVGATGALNFLVIGFCMGIAGGFGVLIAQSFGAGDMKRLRHYVAMSFILCAAVMVVLTISMTVAVRPILELMQTPGDIIDDAESYIRVIFLFLGASLYYNMLAAILRGVGDSKTPLYFLVLSSVLNVVLDLVFIIVLKLGVAGAAYATVIAQGVSAVLCFIYMYIKFPILRLHREDWKFNHISAMRLLNVGLPMALQFSITAVGVMILQSAINGYGSTVVAAFTAASKVENLSTQAMVTLGTSIATYCGQNLGAGRFDRIKEGIHKSYFVLILTIILACVVSSVFGEVIIGWFISNPSKEILDAGMQYLNTISYFYFALAILFMFRNALQGLGNSFVPMMCGAAEMVMRTFMAFVIAKEWGYAAICMASPMAWIGAAVPLIVTYYIQMRNPEKSFGVKQRKVV